MKYRIFTLALAMLLIVSMFCGCAVQAPVVGNVEPTKKALRTDLQRVPDSTRSINEESVKIYTMNPNAPLENIPDEEVPLAAAPADGPLTKRDAESIAIHHAGFEINQVSFLYTKLVEDTEVTHFEVNFRVGTEEYEINVHSETGEVLAFSKVDING